ncbi:hypothetical protein [Pseudomonas sp. NPDC087804]|uniref:AbiTii domain-containing protein n=1 Tax=Pseudomonas sp. NPDC087804 TaxID=3364449 RepID=UPI0038265851
MGSLVLELQADALDETKSVIYLLQKARAVSVKLNVTTIQEWIGHELEGYPYALVPEYREVTGLLMCRGDAGFVPLRVDDVAFKKTLTMRRIQTALPELFNFLDQSRDLRQIMMGFHPEQAAMLMSGMHPPMEPWLAVEKSSVHRIVASVRTKILDFALDLEQQGVLGDGMTFTKDEKERASSFTYNINIEKMTDSQIQQGTTNSTQNYHRPVDLSDISAFVEKLMPVINELKSDTDRAQIQSDLEAIRTLIKAPKPKTAMIRECLGSVKTILEGAAGSILASEYLPLIGPLIASIPSS